MKFILFLVFTFLYTMSFAKTNNKKLIESQINLYIDGWKQQDGLAFARPFAPNASFINIFTMKLRGKEAIAKRHQEIFDTFLKGTLFKANKIEIREVSQELAIVLVDWQLDNLTCKKNKPCPKHGTFTHVFHKKNNGQWLIEATQNTMTPKSL